MTDPIPVSKRRASPVRLIDRLWDAAAVLLLAVGSGLFLYARRSLTALGNGTYDLPAHVSAVSRADFHVAQSRIGLWCACAGLILAVVAAVRHRRGLSWAAGEPSRTTS